jgi:hypothetical protein
MISRLLPLIGIAIFICILLGTDMAGISAALSNASIFYIFVSSLLLVPVVLLKALKWKVLIKCHGVNYPLPKSVSAWLAGFSLGMVTPGRLGDLSRALCLKGRLDMGGSLTTVIIDRVVDVALLFCLAIAGIAIFVTSYGWYWGMLLSFAMLFALFLALFFLLTKKGLAGLILRPFFRKMLPERYKPGISEAFNGFYRGLDAMRKRKGMLAFSVVLGLAAWLVSIMQYYFLALALNLGIQLGFLAMIVPVTVLLDILPVSFSGIGTRDAAMVFFFSLAGLPAESAISFSLLILFVSYLLLGLAGMAAWLRNPLRASAR